MNRSVEIINSLRKGMETMVRNSEIHKVRSLRMFNFEIRRVSLRMEVSRNGNEFYPMGMIDVIEHAEGDQKAGCSCTMTELQTGKSENLVLRLQNSTDKNKETLKVFSFFRRVLGLPDNLPNEGTLPVANDSEILETSVGRETESSPELSIDLPDDGGSKLDPMEGGMPERTRGAQAKPSSD